MRELHELLSRLRALERTDAPATLATIARVEGSSYRREGTRMLVEPDGRLTGVLTGGCLERDIVALAAETLAAGRARSLTYDLTADEEAIWGTGSGCAGKVTLLLEPLDAARREAAISWLETVLEARREVRIATLFRFESGGGEDGAQVGDRIAFSIDGVGISTAPRGRGSELVAAPAPPMRKAPSGPAGAPPTAFSIHGAFFEMPGTEETLRQLSDLPAGTARAVDFAPPAGAAEGVASVLLESVLPPIHLVLIGAERDAPALARLGLELGWALTVVDPRPSAAGAARFGAGVSYLGAGPRELLRSGVELSPRTALVLATHRYLDDLAFLTELADARRAPVGHLALLGPVRRRERLLADLARLDPELAATARARLRSPAGLDLGGRAPEEVALAVVAEIQATCHGRGARPLTEKAP